jgi:preprotein translocase subunit SecF
MELFREPNFNFLRWKWHWIGVSLILLVAGVGSLVVKGGPRYGIDFSGGTLVYLKFAQSPDLNRIRDALREHGMGSSTIQAYGRPDNNEIIIGAEQVGSEDEALDASREAILGTLRTTFGVPGDRLDLNNAGTTTLSESLQSLDPLALSSSPTEAVTRYQEIAERITSFRDTERGGLVESFESLRAVEGVPPAVVNTLEERAFLSPFVVRNVEVVGPRVGQQLRRQALLATALALAGILVYIGARFRQWVYGTAAVVAVFHDVLVTVGFLSLLNHEFNLNIVAALLTLMGFSVNDTIVTFDRIRENVRLLRRERYANIVNKSINQTLSRTVLTSGLTFLTVLALFFLGGEVLHGFAFTLVIGTIVGTYSSIFIASPIVVGWIERGQVKVKTA